jgi:tight adherence protein C
MEKLALLLAYGQPSAKLSQELARAGYHSPNAPYVYLGAKVLLLIGGLVGGASLLLFFEYAWTMVLPAAVVCGLLLSFLPNLALNWRRSSRRAEIRQHLPDALDLLEICVTSGMGLDTAWNAVADEVRSVSPTLADEMALTNLELHLGAPRATAMRKMADRTGAEEVSSLVAVLVQAERFGTSIRDALRTFAQTMRERRSMLAQEAAEKIAVKLLFPLVVFIFPAVLVVVAGAAVLGLFQTIFRGR